MKMKLETSAKKVKEVGGQSPKPLFKELRVVSKLTKKRQVALKKLAAATKELFILEQKFGKELSKFIKLKNPSYEECKNIIRYIKSLDQLTERVNKLGQPLRERVYLNAELADQFSDYMGKGN